MNSIQLENCLIDVCAIENSLNSVGVGTCAKYCKSEQEWLTISVLPRHVVSDMTQPLLLLPGDPEECPTVAEYTFGHIKNFC